MVWLLRLGVKAHLDVEGLRKTRILDQQLVLDLVQRLACVVTERGTS